MKKRVLLLVMVLVLSFAAVCSAASNGRVLDAQEGLMDKFFSASSYKAISSALTEEMKKDFDETKFNAFKDGINKDLGKLTTKELLMVKKYPSADELIYAAQFEKGAVQQVIVLLTNKEKPQFINIMIMPFPQDEKKQEAVK